MTATHTLELQAPEAQTEGGFFVSRLDAFIDWSRKNSLWPLGMGLSKSRSGSGPDPQGPQRKETDL